MFVGILFFSGLAVALIILMLVLIPSHSEILGKRYEAKRYETKTEILVLPFFLLFAAAVGRYIGF